MKALYYPGVVVKSIGPTNTRGPGVSMELVCRGLARKVISYKYEHSTAIETAWEALKRAGFRCLMRTDAPDKYAGTILIDWEVEHADSISEIWDKVGKS